jgi:hypothetical protein
MVEELGGLFVFPQPAEYWRGTVEDLFEATKHHPDAETKRHIPTPPCPKCGLVETLPMTVLQFMELFYSEERRNIQEILPHLNRDERERFITGLCIECWNKVMAGD